MAETVARVIERVRDRLDEAFERQWTDRQLRSWIIEGSEDLARRSLQLLDTVNVTAIAATPEYTITESVLEIHGAYWYPTGDGRRVPLQPKQFQAMDNVWWTERDRQTASDPVFFTTWGFPPALKLRVFPAPASGGTIQLMVSRLPAKFDLTGLDDADPIDIPAGWSDLLVEYAEMCALRKDRDPRWQEPKALYEEKLMAMISNGNALTQGGEFIYDGPGGFLPGWLVNPDGGWW